MTTDAQKRAAAGAALAFIEGDGPLGVGTGSTVNRLIELLAASDRRPRAAVSSSEASTRRLREAGIAVVGLEEVGRVGLYVDGADEVDGERRMIKGGGGALTREKILAASAERFVCIVDSGKVVDRLGSFPLAVEVVPMARALVSDRVRALGGIPRLREGFTTDNGMWIVDVTGLDFAEPEALEAALDGIPGVVCNGLFARRPADVVLVGNGDGVRRF